MTRTTPMKKLILAAVSAIALTAAASSAYAQTARNAGPAPVPPNQQQPATAAAPAAAAPVGMPPPASVIWQAGNQQEGIYGYLERPRSAGQVQQIWDEAGTKAGIYTVDACADCSYKVQVREWMVTTIELPKGEVIESADLGDQKGFQVSQRGKNRLAVRPVGHGYDTNLLIYGKSGAIYPVYLRAIGFNALDITDFVVRIQGTVSMPEDTADMAVPGISSDDKGKATGNTPVNAKQAAASGLAQAFAGTSPQASPVQDFVQDAPFDPSKLRGWGQYKLSGNDDTMEPDTVYRDDRFTYIKYGDKRWTQNELPTAYVVVDGIDELVNTRVMGDTYVIESTRPKITLKSGESYLCITYKGGDA
ncbi:TrbG/VirB9 family P-type conjugative transfer protein [Novispirillum itersonii]|uniref:TrbG/VirB9 family P-type conjugative transfer protein n=1 Tax=Novispirillum itersonii TaxID=189 RepID=UPI000363FB3E|nr:TrbG/VirB9 family P-type conjugative transfer protein [Novispirillum itersonii]